MGETMTPTLQLEVERLIYREAYCLDTRDWDGWLACYADDATYWIPAWATETELTTDPEVELALMYMPDKTGLDDRVYRIQSRDSYASTPMPRSCHVVSNVLILDGSVDDMTVATSWTVHLYHHQKGARMHGGRYEYRLRRDEGALTIAAKKIIFLNDKVDVPLDVYNV
ncbi:MAG: aromatic-ring-hydroxylating dioxygenase subunit beta [Alphaproteobacteria bacterium]|jgi:benzoate/toluate 1,2-dioxygenase beta subunit